MNPVEQDKDRAARAAADLVRQGMCVGLGSGSTSRLMVEHLARRMEAEGLSFSGVATSQATADLARSLNIPLLSLDDCEVLDVNIDGADEVDPEFRLIKGLGGALLREKIVASAAQRRVTIVGESKLVDRLGVRTPVPVEVSPFGLTHTQRALRQIAGMATLRLGRDGTPYQTDGGNRIVDCRFEGIEDPVDVDQRLREIPGVFETGLFLGLCEVVVVGRGGGVDILERP